MSDEMIARVIPHLEGYVVQRYNPYFNEWRNLAIYQDEKSALRRASKYSPQETNSESKDHDMDSKR